jgi:hypothetical protein
VVVVLVGPERRLRLLKLRHRDADRRRPP